MTLADLLCLGRPDISEDRYEPLSEAITTDSYSDEKKVVINEADEDEMQGRLSDLRREINDAKVDW